MSKILIVYGSTLGNTEAVAEQIAGQAKDAGNDVVVKNAKGIDPVGLCKGYDLVVFGCSTWGQDELELQRDFIPLFEAFDKIGAKGVKVSVFGCGDDSYKYYCGAVDAISDKLAALGAHTVGDKLKINGEPDENTDAIETWTKTVLAAL